MPGFEKISAPNLIICFIIGMVYFFFDKRVTKSIFLRAFLTSFFAVPLGLLLSYPIRYIFTLFPDIFYFYDHAQKGDFDQWLPIHIGYFISCFLCMRYILIKKSNSYSYLSWLCYGLLALSFYPITLIIIMFTSVYIAIQIFGYY